MKHFMLIVGLPGSGKTHWGRDLSARVGIPFLDDWTQERGVIPADAPVVAISDMGFLYPGNQAQVQKFLKEKYPEATFEWIAFENSPIQCWENVLQRQDGRNLFSHSVMGPSKMYVIPEGARILPVFVPSSVE